MKIEKVIMRDYATGLDEEVWRIWYDSDKETKPMDAPETSVAYCYSGDDLGNLYAFNGTAWVNQDKKEDAEEELTTV